MAVEKDLKPQAGSRRKIGPTDYHAAGVVYLPDEARFSYLLSLPESGNVGQAVNEAMRAIEKENPDLADVLPKSYHILESRTLASLLKTMASISMDKGGESEPDGRGILLSPLYLWERGRGWIGKRPCLRTRSGFPSTFRRLPICREAGFWFSG